MTMIFQKDYTLPWQLGKCVLNLSITQSTQDVSHMIRVTKFWELWRTLGDGDNTEQQNVLRI